MTARVLYVEDDPGVRAFVETLLTGEGHDVTAVDSAEAGADALANRPFDVVLTDFNLPGENADWMLRRARARGALDGTPVIVLTGALDPPGVEGCRVLHKPVDIAVLLATLDDLLPAGKGAAADAERAAGEPQLCLSLYVTSTSRESQKAVRNLRRLLAGFDASRIDLRVIDVADPARVAALEDDRIVVTPTLVRTCPLPKVWAFGDLSRSDAVAEIIGSAFSSEEDR